MSTDIVHFQARSDVAVITLDDGKANALSHEMIERLQAALDRAEGSAAVVLAGRPGRFSAGFDLRVMGAGPQAAKDLVLAGGALLLRLYELPAPLVIACSGHALAAGALLTLVGDSRIGIDGPFKIGLNEVQNGLPMPILGHELARDRLRPTELVAAVLQARIYDPREALAAGWLDRVVAPEDLEQAALEEAARLAKLPGRAYALTKRSLRRAMIEHVRATMEANLDGLLGLG